MTSDSLHQTLREFIDEYRTRCLWFLRADYYPESLAEQLRILDAIQRHGDLKGFKRAARLKEELIASQAEGQPI